LHKGFGKQFFGFEELLSHLPQRPVGRLISLSLLMTERFETHCLFYNMSPGFRLPSPFATLGPLGLVIFFALAVLLPQSTSVFAPFPLTWCFFALSIKNGSFSTPQ